MHPVSMITGVLLLVAVGLGVWWVILGQAPRSTNTDEALAVARETAVNVNSYDYRKIDSQIKLVSGELTGSILDDFRRQQAGIKSAFTRSKATSVAAVLDSATVPTPGLNNEATVMVALQVGYMPQGSPAIPQTELLRLHLVRNSGVWLVDTITNVA